MASPAASFDAAAPSYDAVFTHRTLGRLLRAAVWEHLDAAFHPGDRVLDLGCGTGEDAVRLAQRGIDVLATDVSAGMIAVAREKAADAGVAERVHLAQVDLREHPLSLPASWRGSDGIAGAFSSFGALNCLPDRRRLASTLAAWVRPGGRLVLVLMGPLCPWEIGWHLARGQPRRAVRRLTAGRDGTLAHTGGGTSVRVWYPTPRRLRAEFAPAFRHVRTVGIGVLLPPSYLAGLVECQPRAFTRLAALERRIAGRFPWPWLADHYLMVLERRCAPAATGLDREDQA
ncbi:class I SAM-dependent methyltransferase [Sphaerobacter thermophilus]|uniref:class I SAM-dependent methyltransferase n=1 Tax=Sphaerobacter thermophilus TaxID=2057 RepID=UPI0039C1E558